MGLRTTQWEQDTQWGTGTVMSDPDFDAGNTDGYSQNAYYVGTSGNNDDDDQAYRDQSYLGSAYSYGDSGSAGNISHEFDMPIGCLNGAGNSRGSGRDRG